MRPHTAAHERSRRAESRDLAAIGQRFTWMNNREDDDLVMERLDRAFATVEWVNMYPLCSLRNMPILHSDHGPIVLDLDVQGPFRKRPFRFEHMWTTHPSCKDMVQQAWVLNSHGSRVEQLRKKLLSIRRKALEWNKNVIGKVERDIKLKQDQLQQIQNSISTIKDVRLERSVRNDLEELLNKEELMWPQKARSNWILQGDRNLSSFRLWLDKEGHKIESCKSRMI